MSRKLPSDLKMTVALVLMAAVPVSACSQDDQSQPPSGDQVMADNKLASPGEYGCPEMSWVGTIMIEGETYGMALYSDYGARGEGALMLYGEDWRIFDEPFETTDSALEQCSPGSVVMAGYDEGIIDTADRSFESVGTVDEASGVFAEWVGHAVHQSGTFGPVSVAGLVDVEGFTGFLEIE